MTLTGVHLQSKIARFFNYKILNGIIHSKIKFLEA